MSNLFAYVDKFMGNLGISYTQDSLTDTTGAFLNPEMQQAVTVVKNPTETTLNSPQLSVANVNLTKNQPSVTPEAGSATTDNGELDNDSYRYGGASSSGTGDNLATRRTLGERANDKDDLAHISLSISDRAANLKGFEIKAYSRFFLQSVSESQQEKMQVVETFSDYYAYFFGKRPVTYTFTGLLLNDQNHRWANDLRFYYEKFFRGTASTELGGTVSISYDGNTVTGFFMGMSMNRAAEMDKGIPFSLSMLVVNHDVNGRYSADISSLISKRTQELQTLSSQIQAFIDSTNKTAKSQTIDKLRLFANSKVKKNKQFAKKATDKKINPNTVVKDGQEFVKQTKG